MLAAWPIVEPLYALELLDSNFADTKVREFAMKCLEALTDRELINYLLQLIQVTKYELYHCNALTMFLLRRGVYDYNVTGHAFFWHLRSESNINPSNLRFLLLIEAYAHAVPLHTSKLVDQVRFVKQIREISNLMKHTKPARRSQILQSELEKMIIPPGLQLPLNPKSLSCLSTS